MVRAQGLPERYTLSRYVPEDVWMVVHAVENPERAFLQEQWGEVWEAVKAARLDQDLVMMLQHDSDPDSKASTMQKLDRVYELVGSVNWTDLVAKETVFAERRARSGIRYDYIFLARGRDGSGEKNFAALTKLVEEGAGMMQSVLGVKFALRQSENQDSQILTVGLLRPEDPKPVEGFFLLRHGDVIGAVVGRQSFKKVQALFLNHPNARSILTGERFQRAVSEVREPADSIMFFDMKAFMSDMCVMCERIGKVSEKYGHQSDVRPENALRSLMNLADVIDYAVTSTSTKGLRESSQSVVRIQEGKQNSEIAKAFLDRESFKKFDRFIPADAVSYSVKSFVDLGRLYKLALEFVSSELPDGKELVAEFQTTLDGIGLNPTRDIFSWLSGEIVQVELPGASQSPMGGNDSVWFIRTKDPKLAWEKINVAIDYVNRRLQSRGQMLMVTPADVNAKGFRQVTLPMLAMFIRPVIGVHREWVVVSTSADAVNRCLAVEAGEAPSIATNKRFRAEGVCPDGAVMSASFSDTSDLGDNMAQAATMAGMFGGMIASQMGPDAPPEARELLPRLIEVGMKAAPILKELDFYRSQSSVTTYDGKTKLETMQVTTYRSPKPKPPPPPSAPRPPSL